MTRSRLLYICALLMLISACNKAKHAQEFDLDEPFRDGDLVLRCGWGAESRLVTHFSRAMYSHIGILLFDSLKNTWMVVHAVPGEAPHGEPEYLKYEPATEFFSPLRAQCGAWMRIDCSDEQAARAAKYCLAKQREKTVFDHDYLLQDSTQLYCCELVWLAYRHEGMDISSGNRHAVPSFCSTEYEGIFPSDIENGNKKLFINSLKFKCYEKN